MRATVFHGPSDVRIEQVPDAALHEPTDAVVRITHACICGSDLWPYRGREPFQPGWRLGHEWMGIVEEVGSQVTTIKRGDRVIAPFAFSDGTCECSTFFLIGFRAFLGVGGALLLPPSLTLLTHAFPDPRVRARAMGIWASVSGVALVAGPVIGGLLVGTLGWRSIFVINVPLALISFAVILRQVSETPTQAQRRLDPLGN